MSETGGLYAYHRGKELAQDPTNTFGAFIHAAMRTATLEQFDALIQAFPQIHSALVEYDATGSRVYTVEELLGLPPKE